MYLCEQEQIYNWIRSYAIKKRAYALPTAYKVIMQDGMWDNGRIFRGDVYPK